MEITQKLFPVAFEKFSTERRKKPMIELVLLYYALRLFHSASMCSKKELENKKRQQQSNLNHTGVIPVNPKKETCMVLNNFPSISDTNS